jgi:hypothetical protein
MQPQIGPKVRAAGIILGGSTVATVAIGYAVHHWAGALTALASWGLVGFIHLMKTRPAALTSTEPAERTRERWGTVLVFVFGVALSEVLLSGAVGIGPRLDAALLAVFVAGMLVSEGALRVAGRTIQQMLDRRAARTRMVTAAVVTVVVLAPYAILCRLLPALLHFGPRSGWTQAAFVFPGLVLAVVSAFGVIIALRVYALVPRSDTDAGAGAG